jgi:hypothetical protein
MFDFQFTAASFEQRGKFFLVNQFPWATSTRGWGMPALMLREPAIKIVRGTNIKFTGSLTLQDVKKGRHSRNGRPVGTRTPDLYRVKVAL